MNGKEIFEKIAEHIQYYDNEFKKLNIPKTNKAYAIFILNKLNTSKRFQFTSILGYFLITFGEAISHNPELLNMLTQQYIGFANSHNDKLIGAKSLKMGAVLYNLAPSFELRDVFIRETKKQIDKFAQTILYELILIGGGRYISNGYASKELDIKPALRTIMGFQQITNGLACRHQINEIVKSSLLKLDISPYDNKDDLLFSKIKVRKFSTSEAEGIANFFLKSTDFVKGEWKNLLNVIFSLNTDIENYALNNKIEPTGTYYISIKEHCGVHFYGDKLLEIKEQLNKLATGMTNLTQDDVLMDDEPCENISPKSFSLNDLF